MKTEEIIDSIYQNILIIVYNKSDINIKEDWTVENEFYLDGKNIAKYKIHFDTDINPSIYIIELLIGLIDETPLKCNIKQIKAGLITKLHEHFKTN